MSTLTVARRGGQIAIASDTLTTGGIKDSAAYVKNHHKILPLGESYRRRRLATPALLELRADGGAMAGVVRRLHQKPADVLVARLRDGALHFPPPAGVLARDQPEVRH